MIFCIFSFKQELEKKLKKYISGVQNNDKAWRQGNEQIIKKKKVGVFLRPHTLAKMVLN